MADVKSPENKVFNIEDKLLPEMFATYASIKRDIANPSSFILWNNETGASKACFLRVCHADMRYGAVDIKPDEMVTAIPFTDEIDLFYQRMLLSGPFRAVADHIELKTGGTRGKYHYAHITDLGTFPANVLNNYCIATRLPIEHSHLLPMFEKMLEKGYDETFSILLSFSRSGKINGPRTMALGGTNSNHMWFDSSSNWANLLKGNFEKPSRPYKFNPLDTIPANSIWGTDADMARKMRGIGDDEEIAELFGFGLKKAVPTPFVPNKIKRNSVKLKPNAAAALFNEAVQAMQAGAQPGAMAVDIEVAQPPGMHPAQWVFQAAEGGWVNAGQHAPQPVIVKPIPFPQWQVNMNQPDQPEVDIDDDDEDLDDGLIADDFDDLDDDF